MLNLLAYTSDLVIIRYDRRFILLPNGMFVMVLRRIVCFYLLLISSCSAFASEAVLQNGESFQAYRQRLSQYFEQHKAWVNAANKAVEIDAVLPFERMPAETCSAATKKVGVLLFHGLSDSPFSMRDPAQALADRCIYTRVMLLPGHGSRAEDLIDVTRDDWRLAVAQAVASFRQQVDHVYLGGFSTGGALVTEYAWQHPEDIEGLVLFSPLFKINASIDWLSPWLSPFINWLDHYPSDDYAKYASIAVPAIAQAYKIAKEVRQTVLDNQVTMPVFMALSEEDATVDSEVSMAVYQQAMSAAKGSHLVLYSATRVDSKTSAMDVVNTNLPEQRIYGFAHMAVHGAPENTYYGKDGSYRICGWYQGDADKYQECRTKPNNWFGEKSDVLSEKSSVAARLSWNPYFSDLMDQVASFVLKN